MKSFVYNFIALGLVHWVIRIKHTVCSIVKLRLANFRLIMNKFQIHFFHCRNRVWNWVNPLFNIFFMSTQLLSKYFKITIAFDSDLITWLELSRYGTLFVISESRNYEWLHYVDPKNSVICYKPVDTGEVLPFIWYKYYLLYDITVNSTTIRRMMTPHSMPTIIVQNFSLSSLSSTSENI